MDPSIWGPQLWKGFHEYAKKYPIKSGNARQKRAFTWYKNFTRRLPCGECAFKYKSLFECTMPLTKEILSSRDALFAWTVSVHNVVNVLLKKPLFDLEDARTMYGV